MMEAWHLRIASMIRRFNDLNNRVQEFFFTEQFR